MARTRLPNPLARRHLLERELETQHALRLAEAYLAQGRVVEAVPFLAKAGDEERLEALREEAVAEGDAFLLRALAEATGVDPGGERWARLAEQAEASGKHRYAAMARRQIEMGSEN
jgi:hypothetical protein